MARALAPGTRAGFNGDLTARRTAARALWCAVLAAALWYVSKSALPYLTPGSTALDRYGGNSAALGVHIIFGVVALLLGPFQFVTHIRHSRPGLHRMLGRFYLAAIAVGATAAIIVLLSVQRSLPGETGLYALASAWLVTSGMALAAVRLRQFEQHREWMIRSYVVTFAFVVFRVGTDLLTAWDVAPRRQVTDSMGWLCWAVPLLVTEVALQGRKILASVREERIRPAVAPARSAVSPAIPASRAVGRT
jgi:uncharacterized membrane protein